MVIICWYKEKSRLHRLIKLYLHDIPKELPNYTINFLKKNTEYAENDSLSEKMK